jgi:hypothetical protein
VISVRLRCDQNRIFGCGRISFVPAEFLVIGRDRLRVLAGGRCEHCGLPLARVRDADKAEKEIFASSVVSLT